LYLVEGEVFHTFGVDHESSLGNGAELTVLLRVVVVICVGALGRETWLWDADDRQWVELAGLAHTNKSPVVETAFPEFTKVDHNFLLSRAIGTWCYTGGLKLMPCQQMMIVPVHWGWCCKSKEDWSVFLFGTPLNDSFNHKVLPNTSDHRSEGLLELPVKPIIEHIEQDYSLVSNCNISITLELDQKPFNPIQSLSIICNLGNKQSPLDFFKIFQFLC
tara:strand:- start:709 stop:1362 length:654 start_codon:yes stop_codon:yes gene_type:complete